MALSKQTATAIVGAVRKDAECRRRINSVLRALPDDAGLAGPIRNWALTWKLIGRKGWGWATRNQALKNEDLSDPRYADLACSGIADAAVKAVKAAAIAEVKDVSREDREIPADSHHSAVLVVMKDASEYIFDWWLTLSVDNPIIFHKKYWTTKEHVDAMRHTYRHFNPDLYDLK